MLDVREFLLRSQLTSELLEAWITEGWLRPQHSKQGPAFSELDLARAQLIRDLTEDLGVNEEGIAIILDLLDQMHGLRRTLRELSAALDAQPIDLQKQILSEIRSRRPILLKGLEEDR